MTSIRDHKSDGSQELSLEIQKANYFATAAKENWISMVSFAVFILADSTCKCNTLKVE